jgi:hypothetical protein
MNTVQHYHYGIFENIFRVGFPGTLSFSDHMAKGGPKELDAW